MIHGQVQDCEVSEGHRADCEDALGQAFGRAPFYRAWQAGDPGPGAPLARRFAALPVLTKRDLRAHMPKGFVPQDRDFKAAVSSGELELVSTSGTCGDRSTIVWYQPWWDGSEHAAATLHTGLDRVINGSQREAVLTTPLCAGNICHMGDLTMESRTMGRLLFLNVKPDPGHWTPADMDRMIDELNRFQPELLEADPAYLAILARYACERGAALHRPRFVSLTYEFPSRVHSRQIRRAFSGTPVLSSYGSTETGHVFTECEHGRLHQNTAYCRLDFQPLSARHEAPRVGRILVTMLRNPWVSLLRFDVGDLVRLAAEPCPCGRTAGLTAAAIEGRSRDVTFAADGRAVTVGRLDAALEGIDGLLAYQVEQHEPARHLFRYVALPGAENGVAGEALACLRPLYGPGAEIVAQRETALAPEPSGKFRLAGTRFPWDPAMLFDGEEKPA
jgi:phenylacetate-coenzyme A ligase PaaK-like adenylate-forming protein